MRCIHCKKEIAGKIRCPFCGAQQPQADPFVTLGDLPGCNQDVGSHYSSDTAIPCGDEMCAGSSKDFGTGQNFGNETYSRNDFNQPSAQFRPLENPYGTRTPPKNTALDEFGVGGFQNLGDLLPSDDTRRTDTWEASHTELGMDEDYLSEPWHLSGSTTEPGRKERHPLKEKSVPQIYKHIKNNPYFVRIGCSAAVIVCVIALMVSFAGNRADEEKGYDAQSPGNVPQVTLETPTSPKVSPETVETPPLSEAVPAVDNTLNYDRAVGAYAAMLDRGVSLPADNGKTIKATHYQLLDMNSDGIPEIIVYAVQDYVPSFEIYTYKGEETVKIADSVNTCDISLWYNAGHEVYICGGSDVYASAVKANAEYDADSSSLLKYDGTKVTNSNGGSDGYSNVEKLISNSVIVGGIQFAAPENSTVKEDNKTNVKDDAEVKLSDGEYYGHLQAWTDDSMVVELYEFGGWNEVYMYREFTKTGKVLTLDTGGSSVWLEWPWGEGESDIKCQTIEDALNTQIWGGGTTVRENCTFEIHFTVKKGIVEKIVLLYAA